MPYIELHLDPSVPPEILRLVNERIEPVLRDVKLMLEFPKVQGQPGFNLTAAPTLFGLIGGLSRVFYSNLKLDSDAFQKVAQLFPLADEPTNAPDAVRDPTKFAEELYKSYRCNLVHSLGFLVKWSKSSGRHDIVNAQREYLVTRCVRLPLNDDDLRELDGLTRPDWLSPTLTDNGQMVHLSADALYWGTRRLVKSLAENAALRKEVLQFLQPWVAPAQTLTAARAVTSSQAYVFSTSRSHGATTLDTVADSLPGTADESSVDKQNKK